MLRLSYHFLQIFSSLLLFSLLMLRSESFDSESPPLSLPSFCDLSASPNFEYHRFDLISVNEKHILHFPCIRLLKYQNLRLIIIFFSPPPPLSSFLTIYVFLSFLPSIYISLSLSLPLLFSIYLSSFSFPRSFSSPSSSLLSSHILSSLLHTLTLTLSLISCPYRRQLSLNSDRKYDHNSCTCTYIISVLLLQPPYTSKQEHYFHLFFKNNINNKNKNHQKTSTK
jgi:hypothetical protein